MQLPTDVLKLVDEAIEVVKRCQSLARRETVLKMLGDARAEAERALRTPLRTVDPAAGEADLALSLVLSTARGTLPAPPNALPGCLPGEDFDPGWGEALQHYLHNYLHNTRVPFRTHDESAPAGAPGSGVIFVPDAITIAMVGDWGFLNEVSTRVAEQMRALQPDYTIHLGDVYYSGAPDEERDNFTSRWPAGRRGALALNSNHEMYSGGEGYFSGALASEKFALQGGRSYFALENAGSILFGLDSAYPSHAWLYQKGDLDDVQLGFVRKHAARARAAGKRIMVLTHHQPIEMNGDIVPPLCDRVAHAVGPGELYWYWGHVHGAAVFKPKVLDGVTLHGRCIGHGSIPEKPYPKVAAMEWRESQDGIDPEEPRRALNGFMHLRIDGSDLQETLYGEDGSVRPSGPALSAAA